MKHDLKKRTPCQLSIVIPCFNEEEVLGETSRRLVQLLESMTHENRISENSKIVFVDDGSTDRTWSMIEKMSKELPFIGGIKLSRNRGHQNALLAGLYTAEGEVLISIDADLQDDLAVIPRMIEHYYEGSEVVYGVRKDRSSDNWFKRGTANAFYRMMSYLGAESINNHADYRLMSRRAIEALKEFGEVNLFLRGIVPLIGFKSSIVSYVRTERMAGVSKYPLRKMLGLALNAITSFSVVPLRLITYTGFAVFLLSTLGSVWTMWIKVYSHSAIPGWASTMLPIFLLGGIQIFCIGMLGEYMGKIYQEVKARPRYIIERVID